MKEKVVFILITIAVVILGIGVGFGINTLIVWGVCKLMGWAFAWKWVILFTIGYALLASLFRQARSKE